MLVSGRVTPKVAPTSSPFPSRARPLFPLRQTRSGHQRPRPEQHPRCRRHMTGRKAEGIAWLQKKRGTNQNDDL